MTTRIYQAFAVGVVLFYAYATYAHIDIWEFQSHGHRGHGVYMGPRFHK